MYTHDNNTPQNSFGMLDIDRDNHILTGMLNFHNLNRHSKNNTRFVIKIIF